MKPFRVVFFAALVLLRLNSAQAQTRYLLPDSYELDASGIGRGVTVRKTDKGYTAIVSFAPSYRLASEYVISESEDSQLPDVVQLPVTVTGFDYLLKDSFGPTALRSISYQYFGQKFRMILDLTNDYTEDQISKILTFSTFYGSTSARVVCSEGTYHELCDRRLDSIPTFNQFKIEADPVAQQKYDDFISMYEYRYQIAAKNNAVNLSPAELDRLFRLDMLDGGLCKPSLSSMRLGICNAVQRLSPGTLSLYDSMRSLGKDLYKRDIGDDRLDKIAPILVIGDGHKGNVVSFEMRDHLFSWPGTSWSQTVPDDYPNFWAITWADPSTPPRDISFAEDFFFSKFEQGFYFSDRVTEYGFATGGFMGWTNASGEAFRFRGVSRGGLISGRISTRFGLKDEKNWPRTYLEIMQRAPGERGWTSAAVYRPPASMTNKVADGEGLFYSIENLFIPEGREVLLRFVVPPEIQWDARGQIFTLYLAELRGVRCPLEIYQNYRPFCK